MKKSIVQLIPGLIQLETNAKKIANFSFWDDAAKSSFFNIDKNSKFKFSYYVTNDIPLAPPQTTLYFSNASYFNDQWFYYNKKGPLELKFYINEKTREIKVNRAYHEVFVKIGYLQPAGCILTDYIVYQIEKAGIVYHDGAAACLNNKTFIFFGAGRNFKTTAIGFILENGGCYIGEEFFLLDGNKVFATIPNIHQFDLRMSHKKLFANDLSQRKKDISEYNTVIFLVYSDRDSIDQIDLPKANEYANLFHGLVNTYYYNFFKSKDVLSGNSVNENIVLLSNTNAKYYIIRFTNIQKVFNFIKDLSI